MCNQHPSFKNNAHETRTVNGMMVFIPAKPEAREALLSELEKHFPEKVPTRN